MAKAFAGIKKVATPKQVLAGRDLNAHKMFGNKTLIEIAEEFKLEEQHVDIFESSNGIVSALLVVKGVEYFVPMSKGLIEEYQNDGITAERFAQCFLRITQAVNYVPNPDDLTGPKIKQLDADGEEVTSALITVGKPQGVLGGERAGIFDSEETETETEGVKVDGVKA